MCESPITTESERERWVSEWETETEDKETDRHKEKYSTTTHSGLSLGSELLDLFLKHMGLLPDT